MNAKFMKPRTLYLKKYNLRGHIRSPYLTFLFKILLKKILMLTLGRQKKS